MQEIRQKIIIVTFVEIFIAVTFLFYQHSPPFKVKEKHMFSLSDTTRVTVESTTNMAVDSYVFHGNGRNRSEELQVLLTQLKYKAPKGMCKSKNKQKILPNGNSYTPGSLGQPVPAFDEQDLINLEEAILPYTRYLLQFDPGDHPTPPVKLLTLFTTLTNYDKRYTVERNVLYNWAQLLPWMNIIVFASNKTELTDYASTLGWTILPIPRLNIYNAPFLRDMFQRAKELYTSEFYGFANADILLTPNLISTLQYLEPYSRDLNFFPLVIARRLDIEYNYTHVPDFQSWSGIFTEIQLKKPSFFVHGYDLIVCRHCKWEYFSDFVIGKPGFDQYIPILASNFGTTVIDISNTIVLLHQKLESLWNKDHASSPSNLYNLRIFFSLTKNGKFLAQKKTEEKFASNILYMQLKNGEESLTIDNPSKDGTNPTLCYLKFRWPDRKHLRFQEA